MHRRLVVDDPKIVFALSTRASRRQKTRDPAARCCAPRPSTSAQTRSSLPRETARIHCPSASFEHIAQRRLHSRTPAVRQPPERVHLPEAQSQSAVSILPPQQANSPRSHHLQGISSASPQMRARRFQTRVPRTTPQAAQIAWVHSRRHHRKVGELPQTALQGQNSAAAATISHAARLALRRRSDVEASILHSILRLKRQRHHKHLRRILLRG